MMGTQAINKWTNSIGLRQLLTRQHFCDRFPERARPFLRREKQYIVLSGDTCRTTLPGDRHVLSTWQKAIFSVNIIARHSL